MNTLIFSKERASQFLAAFQASGGPIFISPTAGDWTPDELMQVAAAAIVVARELSDPPCDSGHFEYREAKAQTEYDNVCMAVEFFADLTTMVEQGDYDEKCSPIVEGEMSHCIDDDGIEHRGVRIVAGYKSDLGD